MYKKVGFPQKSDKNNCFLNLNILFLLHDGL